MTNIWKQLFIEFRGIQYHRRLSLSFVTIVILIGLGSNAQSPLLVFDDPGYDQFFSSVYGRGNNAIVNFLNESHDYVNNYHISFTTQLLITQDGGISKTQIIDSTLYPGFGPGLRHMLVRNDTVYHFGGLYSMDNSVHRMLIRRTDLNLNFLDDVKYNFDNRLISISDVVFVENDMLVSGWVSSGSATHGFILRIDDQMMIQDSLFFPFPMAFWFTFALHPASDGFLRLFVTSNISHCGLLFRFQENPLVFVDTLFTFGLISPHQAQMTNAYGVRINDSVVLSPNEYGSRVDTSAKEIGWLKWDLNGNVLDTLRPHKDTVIAGQIGHVKPMLINHDTIVMLYSHDNDWKQYPPSDSTKVALLFADLQGNPIKTSYFGSGYYFSAENLVLFDNGNYLATARGLNFTDWPIVSTNHLFVWLLNSHGDVIQSTKIPIQYPKPSITINPNPAGSTVTVSITDKVEKTQIVIFDMAGRTVLTAPLTETTATLDVSHLVNGIYIIRIFGTFKPIATGKLIISK